MILKMPGLTEMAGEAGSVMTRESSDTWLLMSILPRLASRRSYSALVRSEMVLSRVYSESGALS